MVAKYTKIFENHKGFASDKWSLYLEKYEEIFKPYRTKRLNLLEIGVQNGGSLEIWAKYFTNAVKIIGCDIDKTCSSLRYNSGKIQIVIGDATDKNTIYAISDICQKFNIIIDDGSHNSNDIIKSFVNYFRNVANNGIYVVEDLHCSYWKEYGGGLFHPYSSISFFKALADVINFEHWGFVSKPTKALDNILNEYNCEIPEHSLSYLHSIEFVNSMCIIKKRQKNRNVLGKQRVAGKIEIVKKGHFFLDGNFIDPPCQSKNKWNITTDAQIASLQEDINRSSTRIAELQEEIYQSNARIEKLQQENYQGNTRIAELQEEIYQGDAKINEYANSSSWKVTKPYRFFGRIVRSYFKKISFLRSLITTYGITNLMEKIYVTYCDAGLDGIIYRANNIKSLYSTTGALREPFQKTHEDIAGLLYKHHNQDVKCNVLISVIICIYKTPLKMLKQSIDSILNQSYKNWELILVDDCSENKKITKMIRHFQKNDSRIKVIIRSENGNISAANNTGLKHVSGQFFTILDHDDTLHPDALYHAVISINRNPNVDYIYSDEDKITRNGEKIYGPFFKPDWSPEYILSMMYTCHMSMFRTSLVKNLGGYNSEFDGAQDYELVLRVINQSMNIVHIPMVLYHWRVWENSTAETIDAKPESIGRARKAIENHLDEKKENFSINDSEFKGHFNIDFYPKEESLVSIIIPTANGEIKINGCYEKHINAVCKSIFRLTEYKNYEIIVVHNGNLDSSQLVWLKSFRNIKLSHYQSEQFSLAQKINQGSAAADGEYLVIMNDDIRVISSNWLTLMLGMVQRDGVGVVGPKLLFPDNTIQHAGVVLLGGLPGHAYYKWPVNSQGYALGAAVNRNYSAVTGACSITPKKLFNILGGYSNRYPLNYNDVDYCLRASKLGYRSVYLANVELYHYEGVSKEGGRSVKNSEILTFLEDWGEEFKFDPYYNPSLNQMQPYV
ncbi:MULTISPECIES: glycosyltransferase [unclassified Endozoicomonas]|uniref:glycosyltransferase n=1 Tax=unclassified Endozoicomonas TaxID=2644528 RepID=UPI003BAF3BA5